MRDDLIPEENEVVYEAMKRLTDKEMFDRTFRLRRAVQLNMTKEVLPPEEWISIEKVSRRTPILGSLRKSSINNPTGCSLSDAAHPGNLPGAQGKARL